MTNRRSFLKRTSAMLAAGLFAKVPTHLWNLPARALFPSIDEALLKELALKAMDAACQAGATFADIRLTAARGASVGAALFRARDAKPVGIPPGVVFPVEYGIRTIIDGSWGFASGAELTIDAVTRAARTAVSGAKSARPRHRSQIDLAPLAPVSNGTWATPIQQDPLDVPLSEQAELALAAVAEASKVKEATSIDVDLEWRRPVCVFAATDGTLLVQHLSFAWPSAVVRVATGPDIQAESEARLKTMRRGAFGYEAASAATLARDLREHAEREVERTRAASRARSAELGRYDVVFSAEAAARLLVDTVGEALNLQRALGYFADVVGTSFAAPPAEMLGTYRIGSKLLTVHADRTLPHGAATVGWDDDGIKSREYSLVKDGIVTDYHTNRETAVELAAWYRQRGEPLHSNGTARRTGAMAPLVAIPNLTLAPAASETTTEDLIADTKRGFYVEAVGGGADQQVINAQYFAPHVSVREIRQGKLGEHVSDFGFQLLTEKFWRSIDGLGGPGTVEPVTVVTDQEALNNHVQALPASTVRAVPVRARGVNVLNLGRAS